MRATVAENPRRGLGCDLCVCSGMPESIGPMWSENPSPPGVALPPPVGGRHVFSANGEQGLNCLSHTSGQPHISSFGSSERRLSAWRGPYCALSIVAQVPHV